MSGTVVHGFHIGSALGFPTANVSVDSEEKLIPADGVYAVWVDLPDGSSYPGMLNIGNRPTMDNGAQTTIEVHLLGFSGGLYGQQLTIRFVKYLRPEQRFSNKDELVTQLRKDRIQVEQLLKR